jgi:hypothetical protein
MTRKDIQLIIEAYDAGAITSTDIYTFYYCALLINPSFEATRLKREFLLNLRIKYLNAFKKALRRQLEKYAERGRYLPEFDLESVHSDDLETLATNMRLTHRTQKYDSNNEIRLNRRWNDLTTALLELEKAQFAHEIQPIIDRINNITHNTGAPMLDKLDNSRALLDAFDGAHQARSEAVLRQRSYPEFRYLE